MRFLQVVMLILLASLMLSPVAAAAPAVSYGAVTLGLGVSGQDFGGLDPFLPGNDQNPLALELTDRPAPFLEAGLHSRPWPAPVHLGVELAIGHGKRDRVPSTLGEPRMAFPTPAYRAATASQSLVLSATLAPRLLPWLALEVGGDAGVQRTALTVAPLWSDDDPDDAVARPEARVALHHAALVARPELGLVAWRGDRDHLRLTAGWTFALTNTIRTTWRATPRNQDEAYDGVVRLPDGGPRGGELVLAYGRRVW